MCADTHTGAGSHVEFQCAGLVEVTSASDEGVGFFDITRTSIEFEHRR